MMLEAAALGMGVQAMLTPRPDLFATIGEAVGHAYGISVSTEFPRCMEGKAAMEVVVCLGSGRCLYPSSGTATRHCPFCKTLPGGFVGKCNSEEAVRQLVRGN